MRPPHLFLLLILTLTPPGRAEEASIEIPPIGQIESMVSLPISGMKAVESSGRIVFLSDSGRFVIDGTLYDAWSRQSLTTVDAIREAANTLDLKRLGLDMDDLQPLKTGAGDKQVLVFVDPRCPHCHALLQQALQLTETYTFQLLPVPVLGPDSERQVRQLACASDRAAAAHALVSGRVKGLVQAEDCDLQPMQRTLVTAQILGVQGVPFVIAPDGRVSRGRPDDLAAWLENR